MHSKIYLVRHPETVSNKKSLFGDGPLDNQLSELGLFQLQSTRGFFDSRQIKFDCVISGSQVRQLMTARGIVGDDFPITEDVRIHEQSVGGWSGLIKGPPDIEMEMVQAWRAGDILPPGGESKEQLEGRVLACWRELILPAAQGLVKDIATPNVSTGNILVATSGNPIRVILGDVLGIPSKKQSNKDIQNCSISVLRVVLDKKTNKFKVYEEVSNYTDHLLGVGFAMLPGTF